MRSLINSITEIFNEKLNGGLITIGNTVTVVGDKNDKSKEFLQADGKFTYNSDEIGSNAYLDIPEDSKIKFAVLEWHSTINSNNSDDHYNPITFITPNEEVELYAKSDFTEATYQNQYGISKSVKWVDVTSLINKSKNGSYTVKGIYTSKITDKNLNHDQSPGWSLSVVYENKNMNLRNIIINIGIKEQSNNINIEERAIKISNINIKENTKTYLTIVASNGSPIGNTGLSIQEDFPIIKDLNSKILLGNKVSASNKDPYTKPIVPFDNVFSGIIMNTNTENYNYGKLEVRATCGDNNNNPYNINEQISYKGNRAKLDILSFDISDKIKNNQEDLTITTEFFNANKDFSFEIILCSLQSDIDSESEKTVSNIYQNIKNTNVKEENIVTDNIQDFSLTQGIPNLSVLKSTDKNFIAINDIVQFTIEVANNETSDINNVSLLEVLPMNASFVANSLSIDGSVVPNTSVLPINGISLNTIAVSSKKIVKYKVFFYDLPQINPITINPTIKYTYQANGNSIPANFTGSSSSVTVIKEPLGRVELFSNKKVALSKDKVLYTLILRNNGKVAATNVRLTDLIPTGITYVSNSLIVNGMPVTGDLSSGVTLNNILPKQEILVTFEVLVN